MEINEKSKAIVNIAEEVIKSTESVIIMNLRFLQVAMASLAWTPRLGSASIMSDGKYVYYDPAFVIRKFKNNPNNVTRIYLHILFHFIFHHNFEYKDKRQDLWDMACDIAVENIIIELGIYQTALGYDAERKVKLNILKKRAGGLHAPALYRLFLVEEPSIKETEELEKLFHRDIHELWLPDDNLEISMEQWKKISERVKADLKSFSKGNTESESLKSALEQATREKINYSDFLRRFMTSGESIKINDDEFDYIYYTYGLNEYGNMPLVEPLEYADVKKIKDFVIAIDTSASCKGELVRNFLIKTVEILSDSENFFHKYNVHVLQCDNEVRSDTCITGKEELQKFINETEFNGFGSTDFRPVFEYVDKKIECNEIENLKGLIYFTDGYGVYPEMMPDYDTAFVFLSEDERAPEVPQWAIRLVMDEEHILK